jgi:hypothetical protein
VRRFYADVRGGEVVIETPRDPDRLSSFLKIRVSDVEAIYADWSSKWADFLAPPRQRGTEIRCYVGDSDGHLIEVGQSTRG